MRALPLAIFCAVLAGCGGEPPVEERVTGGVIPSGEPPVVSVCRAATSAFNPGEPLGARTVPSASAEMVRLAYEAGPASPGLTVECAFKGDQVTWRQLTVTPAVGGVEMPVQRAPETATYASKGDTVHLQQQRPGTRTESTWTSVETGGSVNAPTGAE